MGYNIVLLEPEIPNNTGNIGRLSLGTGSKLHLIKPFGFEITDSRLKRAGLDYWQNLEVFYYDSKADFFEQHKDKTFAFFSAQGEKLHWDIPFKDDMFLVFGKESVGLPKDLIEQHKEHVYKIPLYSDHIRSLNIANAVSIVVYEGLRQLNS